VTLDCIEGDGGKWIIVDRDNSCFVLSRNDDAEIAWALAACKLADSINALNAGLGNK